MRLANISGRAVLLTGADRGIDIGEYSKGRYGPSLPAIYDQWSQFHSWVGEWHTGSAANGDADPASPSAWEVTFDRSALDTPSPAPQQIIAIGLNYADHAAESGFSKPVGLPPTFVKFVSSLAKPDCEVLLPRGGRTDWEVELVVVIGKTAHNVPEDKAWDHVAGLTVGQDLSERITQMAGPVPQFSLGKSFPNFAPVGPWLVTPDELPDRNNLGLGCTIDGETMQDGRTADLIYPVPRLVAALSAVITLHPGDLIFTGTPAGVGVGREPQRFLRPGETLTSWVEGIGELHQTFAQAEELR